MNKVYLSKHKYIKCKMPYSAGAIRTLMKSCFISPTNLGIASVNIWAIVEVICITKDKYTYKINIQEK
jgi:hypothetical protein